MIGPRGNAGWNWTSVCQHSNVWAWFGFWRAGLPRRRAITIRRYLDELEPQHQAFLETADALGYYCADANDGYGAGPQPMNKLGRLRVSAAVGYLAPARIRPNLSVRPDTSVRRLLFKGSLHRGRNTAQCSP